MLNEVQKITSFFVKAKTVSRERERERDRERDTERERQTDL